MRTNWLWYGSNPNGYHRSCSSRTNWLWYGSNANGYCVLIIQAILILMPYIDKARPRLMSPVAYAVINPNF